MKVKPFRIKKACEAFGFVVRGVIGVFVMGLMLGCGTIFKDQAPAPDQPQAATIVPKSVSATPEPTPDGVVVAASFPSATDPNTMIPDSLWKTDSAFGSLFISQKALHVGDIVTIRIVESSSASNKANTTTERESSIKISTPEFFGAEDEVPSSWLFNPLGNLSAGFGSDFEGDGETNRSGDLTAYITSKVTEVLPNGNLRILGAREVAVNNEKQFIHISGIIRSRDISTDNIILSTYIADAKIEYSGRGVIDDRQKPGWLANLFNKLWPF
ncbi:MAG: flagellar biosynthesis protein FlgH [Deltaproteobacteria bacterium]|nr:MAG: flagellar biosynthesis protein FlgH [Deltaproteobacteria bacterium]RLC16912.1 MAG: flagellar biosynthesis protein FlgH [Deltaproteobacteria bacterium]